MIHERIVTTQDEYKTIGRAFAETFVERGARELLKRAEAVAFK
jgi:hypothetical protein